MQNRAVWKHKFKLSEQPLRVRSYNTAIAQWCRYINCLYHKSSQFYRNECNFHATPQNTSQFLCRTVQCSNATQFLCNMQFRCDMNGPYGTSLADNHIINKSMPFRQLPDDVQSDWLKICHSKRTKLV